jgi:hypothetical protein
MNVCVCFFLICLLRPTQNSVHTVGSKRSHRLCKIIKQPFCLELSESQIVTEKKEVFVG